MILISIFSMIFLTSLTGTLIFAFWKLASVMLERFGEIGMIYFLLRIVLIFYLVPVPIFITALPKIFAASSKANTLEDEEPMSIPKNISQPSGIQHLSEALNPGANLLYRVHLLVDLKIQHGHAGVGEFLLINRIIKLLRVTELEHTHHHPVGLLILDLLDQTVPLRFVFFIEESVSLQVNHPAGDALHNTAAFPG